MNTFTQSAFAALLLGLTLPIAAEEKSPEADSKEPPAQSCPAKRPPLPENGRRFRRGPFVWHVFSKLTPEERREMQKLQREDPAKFEEVMQQKAEKLFRDSEQRTAELRELAKRCREATTAEAREELRAKLAAEVEKDFRKRLEENRYHLEELKRQTARMEKDLQRREAKCAEAVNAFTDALIRGGKPTPPQKHGSGDK